jgi:hypothetical protein
MRANVLPANRDSPLRLLVGRAGFEPAKAYASGVTVRPIWPLWYLPNIRIWSLRSDSNRRPAVYKTAALPTELLRLRRSKYAACSTARVLYHAAMGLSTRFRVGSSRTRQTSGSWLLPVYREMGGEPCMHLYGEILKVANSVSPGTSCRLSVKSRLAVAWWSPHGGLLSSVVAARTAFEYDTAQKSGGTVAKRLHTVDGVPPVTDWCMGKKRLHCIWQGK